LDISTFQDETSTFSQIVGDQSPTDTAQNSRKTKSSTIELRIPRSLDLFIWTSVLSLLQINTARCRDQVAISS